MWVFEIRPAVGADIAELTVFAHFDIVFFVIPVFFNQVIYRIRIGSVWPEFSFLTETTTNVSISGNEIKLLLTFIVDNQLVEYLSNVSIYVVFFYGIITIILN